MKSKRVWPILLAIAVAVPLGVATASSQEVQALPRARPAIAPAATSSAAGHRSVATKKRAKVAARSARAHRKLTRLAWRTDRHAGGCYGGFSCGRFLPLYLGIAY